MAVSGDAACKAVADRTKEKSRVKLSSLRIKGRPVWGFIFE
jgi:hypothetical protein